MQIGGKIKKKIKSEEGEGQKIKYRSVHWNNAGSLVRDNGLDQCFFSQNTANNLCQNVFHPGQAWGKGTFMSKS